MVDITWHLAVVVIPLLLTAPLSIYLITYLYRRHQFYDYPLMLLLGAGSYWATCYGIEILMPSFESKMTVLVWEYLGIVLVPPAWLLLGLQLNDQLQRFKPWMLALLLCVPAITMVQVVMWSSWDTYWTDPHVATFGDLGVIDTNYGPGFWIHIAYSYAIQSAGAVLIVTSLFRSNDFYLRQRLSLVLALALPWTANAVYIFRLTELPLDFTPLSIVASGILLIVGVLRYGLGDLVPVAREKIFSQMKEGVMLFDDKHRLIDANNAALSLFNHDSNAVGKPASSLFVRHSELLKLLEPEAGARELLYSGFGVPFRITSEDLNPQRRFPCQLLVFNDLSSGNRIETTLRLIVEHTSGDTGEDFFRSLTRSLGMALGVRYAFVSVMSQPETSRAETLAFWAGDSFRENFTYDLANTPCETLVEERVCVFPEGVAERFPQDAMLERMGISCYIGVRLTDFAGRTTGNLVIMNDESIKNLETCTAVLEVFAIRAASELERQDSDSRLKRSEAQYRRIVETTRDGVCVVDSDGRIEFLNDPMAAMIGQSKEALGGEVLTTLLEVAANEGDAFSFRDDTISVKVTNTERSDLWLTISKTVIESDEGYPVGMLLIFTDVTESHSLEEQKTRFELQLQHAQKLESLGVLAGGIAHDFNNLLMPILGYLDLIHDRTQDDIQVQDYVRRMRDAGGKLADLCNQMLTYSGRGQFIKHTLDLNDALTRLKDLVRASISKNITLEYLLAPQLHAVNVDETQLDQIVINLAINASEAMAELTSGKIEISTGQSHLDSTELANLANGDNVAPGEYVYIEVTDGGSGIASRDISRLFEPFFTTKFTGRGLGMAVVFGIVKGHQGAIKVSSSPRVGTSIRIYFPASEENAELGDQVVELPKKGEAKGVVLVVDDEEMVRNILASMLESIGYEVITAQNGRQGFILFQDNESSLVGAVIDVTMPELDGYGLVADIHRHDRHLPVVLVSGYHAREFEDRQLDDANVTFLQKPFELGKLIAALEASGSTSEVDS